MADGHRKAYVKTDIEDGYGDTGDAWLVGDAAYISINLDCTHSR
jgi:hypothetical protein